MLSVNVRQIAGKASELDPKDHISLPWHVVFKSSMLKNHQVPQIHEDTLCSRVFQMAHHGYRHLRLLLLGFLPFDSCFHAFHSNTVTNSK